MCRVSVCGVLHVVVSVCWWRGLRVLCLPSSGCDLALDLCMPHAMPCCVRLR